MPIAKISCQNHKMSNKKQDFCEKFKKPCKKTLQKGKRCVIIPKCTECIKQSYLAYGEETRPLRLTSELVDLRVGFAKWIR